MRIGGQIGVWKGGLERVLSSIQAAGVAGIEVFAQHLEPFYPDPGQLRQKLRETDIVLSGAYFGTQDFISPEKEEDVVRKATEAIDCLNAVGGEFIILNSGVNKKQRPSGFTPEDYQQLAKVMNQIGEVALKQGVSASVHPHYQSMVETVQDLEKLLRHLDTSKVSLCVHAAHQVLVDADPYAIYEKYAHLVRYVHVGDNSSGDRFKGALLGKGVLDQKRLMRPLLEVGYDGWLIIEDDAEGVSPEEYARDAKRYFEEELGLNFK